MTKIQHHLYIYCFVQSMISTNTIQYYLSEGSASRLLGVSAAKFPLFVCLDAFLF